MSPVEPAREEQVTQEHDSKDGGSVEQLRRGDVSVDIGTDGEEGRGDIANGEGDVAPDREV